MYEINLILESNQSSIFQSYKSNIIPCEGDIIFTDEEKASFVTVKSRILTTFNNKIGVIVE